MIGWGLGIAAVVGLVRWFNAPAEQPSGIHVQIERAP